LPSNELEDLSRGSHPDGIPDEDRLGSSGRTLGEEQREAPPGGGSGGCGLLGLEALLIFALARAIMRE
jgi:hypothetical protein